MNAICQASLDGLAHETHPLVAPHPTKVDVEAEAGVGAGMRSSAPHRGLLSVRARWLIMNMWSVALRASSRSSDVGVSRSGSGW